MKATTEFDAADYLNSPLGRYIFLDEALQPPVGLAMLTGSVDAVVRSAGGAERLASESGVPVSQIEHALGTSDLTEAQGLVRQIAEGLRQHLPASRLVA